MKKIVAGIGFEITGVVLVIYSTLLASMDTENTTQWATGLGRYWQMVLDHGLLPVFVIGLVLLLSGIVFTLWGVFSKSDQ